MHNLRALALLAGVAIATAASGTRQAQAGPTATTLRGTVGPGFTITLKDTRGTTVTAVKPGTYRILIRDLSPIHDFHLRGPGVNKSTTVAGTGSTTWTVRLGAGRYTYVCDPHRTIMHGAVVVH